MLQRLVDDVRSGMGDSLRLTGLAVAAAGALLVATSFFCAAVFGLGCAAATIMPNPWLFDAAPLLIGVSALTFANTSNSLMQITTEPAMRGRVMAIRLAVALGCTPLGAPFVGWVADRFGPRWSVGVAAASGIAAALVALHHLAKHHRLHLSVEAGRLRFRVEEETAVQPH